ncbi:hypothetical protein D3C71_1675430 [compost metagenome]
MARAGRRRRRQGAVEFRKLQHLLRRKPWFERRNGVLQGFRLFRLLRDDACQFLAGKTRLRSGLAFVRHRRRRILLRTGGNEIDQRRGIGAPRAELFRRDAEIDFSRRKLRRQPEHVRPRHSAHMWRHRPLIWTTIRAKIRAEIRIGGRRRGLFRCLR